MVAAGAASARAEEAPACPTVTVQIGAAPTGYRATGARCGDVREGRWRFTLLDGKPLREGEYRRGLEHGPWVSYFPSGARFEEKTYRDGRPEGRAARYHEGGGLAEECTYKDGHREGTLRRFDERGRVTLVRECAAGICRTIKGRL